MAVGPLVPGSASLRAIACSLASSISRRRGSFTSSARRQSRAVDGRGRHSPVFSPVPRGGTRRPLAEPRDQPRGGARPFHAPSGGRPPQGGECVSRSTGGPNLDSLGEMRCQWRRESASTQRQPTTEDSPCISGRAPLRPLQLSRRPPWTRANWPRHLRRGQPGFITGSAAYLGSAADQTATCSGCRRGRDCPRAGLQDPACCPARRTATDRRGHSDPSRPMERQGRH